MRLHKSIASMSGLMLAAGAWAGEMTDGQVRERIVQDSVAAYFGKCACPYNNDAKGDPCGARSAWSKKGGVNLICFAHEVTDEDVRKFRARH